MSGRATKWNKYADQDMPFCGGKEMTDSKKYLNEYLKLKKKCAELQNRIDTLDAKATTIGTIRYDKDKVQSSPEERMTDIVIRKVDLEYQYAKLKRKKDEVLREYMQIFQHLEGYDIAIAIYTWVHGYNTDDIAGKLNIHRRTVLRHREAIIKIVDTYINNS